MPNIAQYDAPPEQLHPSEIPEQSFQREGYMAARLGNERAQMLRQSGADQERALKEVGAGIDTLGAQMERHQAQQEILGGAVALTQLTANLTQHYHDMVQQSDPFDPTVSDRFRRDVLTPAISGFADHFSTPAGKKWAADHADTVAAQMYRQTAAVDMSRAGDMATLGYTKSVNTLTGMVQEHPSMIDTALALVPGTMAALAQTANLPPDLATKMQTELGEKANKEIVMTGLKTAIFNDPVAGLQMAQNPKYTNIIGGDGQHLLSTYAEQQTRMKDYQTRMDNADDRRMQKEAADQAISGIIAKTVQPNGQLVLPKDFAQSISEAIQLPGSNAELGKSMLQFGREMAQDASMGRNDVTNDVLAANFQTRAYLPPDDPHALTYKEVFDAKSAHMLSNTDFAHFNEAVGRNSKSDMNQQLDSKMVTQALSEAQVRLGASAQAPAGQTPPGMRAYSRLMQWFTPAYQAALRKGISSSEAIEKLLTPERIDSFKEAPTANAGSGVSSSNPLSRGFWHSTPAPAPTPAQENAGKRSLQDIFGSELK